MACAGYHGVSNDWLTCGARGLSEQLATSPWTAHQNARHSRDYLVAQKWPGAVACSDVAVLVFPWAHAFCANLGLQPMVNISSSIEVFLSANGLMMLALGTGVGAIS